jgi:hypothetical protein
MILFTFYQIPDWFLNRQRDIKDGKTAQVMANILDNKLREDLERLKKIRAHRGLRHYWLVLLARYPWFYSSVRLVIRLKLSEHNAFRVMFLESLCIFSYH